MVQHTHAVIETRNEYLENDRDGSPGGELSKIENDTYDFREECGRRAGGAAVGRRLNVELRKGGSQQPDMRHR